MVVKCVIRYISCFFSFLRFNRNRIRDKEMLDSPMTFSRKINISNISIIVIYILFSYMKCMPRLMTRIHIKLICPAIIDGVLAIRDLLHRRAGGAL